MKKFTKYLGRIFAPFILPALVVLALTQVDLLRDWLIWCWSHLDPFWQAALTGILGIVLLCSVVLLVERQRRVDDLKRERDQLEEELAARTRELEQLQQAHMRLAEVEAKEDVWRRRDPGDVPFVPRSQRRIVCDSVVNLKGGVGKTTLCANLGATLGLMDPPLRVVVMDLDFQGSLSQACVAPEQLERMTIARLTLPDLLANAPPPDRFRQYLAPMTGVDNVDVVVSHDQLERVNFEQQARFFVDVSNEVRFLFRRLLHSESVRDEFDLVLFDCPPRLTTATVNALACSDYILIPSQVDSKAVDAIPRTLKWIEALPICRARVLGVVVNQVQYWRGSILRKVHQKGLERLKSVVRDADPNSSIFDSLIPLRVEIAEEERGVVPAIKPAVREWFLPLASEFRRRIGR